MLDSWDEANHATKHPKGRHRSTRGSAQSHKRPVRLGTVTGMYTLAPQISSYPQWVLAAWSGDMLTQQSRWSEDMALPVKPNDTRQVSITWQ